MSLARELHLLLFEHDCVIVPGWGGFLAQYRPARLDKVRQLIHPPSKEVGFNRHLLRNDGLLTDHIAHRDGVGFAAANALIEREVAEWQAQLERSGRLEVPRIGIFYRDQQRNLQFDPDDRANFLKEAFGLAPVVASPVVRKAAEPRGIPMTPPPVVVAPSHPARRSWPAAAAVALLLLGGAAATYIGLTRYGGLALGPRPEATYAPGGAVMPPLKANSASFALPEDVFGVRTMPLSDNDSVSLTVDMGSAPADTTAVAIAPRTAMRLRFHVIGGCFAQPENADRLLKELQDKGYKAARLARYGELHPVAFGSFADRQEALDLLASIRTEGDGQAWLLVR
ncbi:MAG: SPOR domain-containing protein [Flavobacteriales bacterium]